MLMYKVGEGKLWLDGSGRVSVPILINRGPDQEDGHVKMIVSPGEDMSLVWTRFKSTRGIGLADGLDEKFAMKILVAAEEARKDRQQLAELARAQKRTVKGKAKAMTALQKRILEQKKKIFKETVQDLTRRGTTKAQLFQLIREAIVEGVMTK